VKPGEGDDRIRSDLRFDGLVAVADQPDGGTSNDSAEGSGSGDGQNGSGAAAAILRRFAVRSPGELLLRSTCRRSKD
jgi:hypothetical protein